MSLQQKIKSVPILGEALVRLKQRLLPHKKGEFTTSGQYWEQRYAVGGNSGAGSYSRLAVFKAEVLNSFVSENDIKTVIEFGSGDGAQLEIAKYPNYVGVDVSWTAVNMCKAKFHDTPAVVFLHTSEYKGVQADLALSLDVIYHLVEDSVFEEYMRQLFAAARRYAIVYASNREEPSGADHVRHRKFTDWIEMNEPSFTLVRQIPNRFPYDPKNHDNTSFADFYIFERK